MKKEKTIRTYQRRTKTGKVVTVKQHTAKYDAAEALKEAAKKKGAGDELENLKKGKPEKAKVEKPTEGTSDYGFTADDYKAWYHWDQDADPKNKSALKVEKALKKQMGTKGYKKYFDEMSDSYSSRGHNKAFKGLSEKFSTGDSKKSVTPAKETKSTKIPSSAVKVKTSEKDAKKIEKAIAKNVNSKEGKGAEKSSKSDSGTTDSFKGHPKVMAKIDKLVQSYQKDIERAQKHIDAGEVRPGGRFSRRMSYKEQKKYAEKQIKELEKGREAHLAGKENKAWGHLRNFVGFNENNVVGKETRAKNKVAAEKKQQKRENARIKLAQLHAQRVAESVERSRKTREAMSGAKRIPADLLKKATTKSRNGKHPVTSVYHGDKTLVEIGGTYYRVTKAEMKDISAAMPSKPAKRYTK